MSGALTGTGGSCPKTWLLQRVARNGVSGERCEITDSTQATLLPLFLPRCSYHEIHASHLNNPWRCARPTAPRVAQCVFVLIGLAPQLRKPSPSCSPIGSHQDSLKGMARLTHGQVE